MSGNSYSALERGAAKFLNKFPSLKKNIKRTYIYINSLLYKKSYRKKVYGTLKEIDYSSGSTFFGYYDKKPTNEDESHVLVHHYHGNTEKKPDAEESVEIILWNKKIQSRAYTLNSWAYNWQQGTRLQWLDNNYFIFNDFDKKKQCYIARVFHKDSSKEVKAFDHPVQDSFKTSYFLSLNYQRLLTMRPDYGYRCLPPLSEQEIKNIDKDGIWKVDFETGKGDLIYSLHDIIHCEYNTLFEMGKHYVNHVMISPKGDKFIFLHRYKVRGQRFDRLLMADAKGQKLEVLADNEMVSHCCWIDNDTILGYLRNDEGEDGFFIIDTESGKVTNFADGNFDDNGDGHPNVYNNWFVCDSYPDKSRMQYLRICHLKTGEIIDVAELFHGIQYYGESRCDLHPRFSPDGQSIFIDTVYEGKRQLKEIDISKLIKND